MLASIVPAFPNGSSLRSVVACKVLRAVGSPMNVWASFSTFDEHSGSRLSVWMCAGFCISNEIRPQTILSPVLSVFFLVVFRDLRCRPVGICRRHTLAFAARTFALFSRGLCVFSNGYEMLMYASSWVSFLSLSSFV